MGYFVSGNFHFNLNDKGTVQVHLAAAFITPNLHFFQFFYNAPILPN